MARVKQAARRGRTPKHTQDSKRYKRKHRALECSTKLGPPPERKREVVAALLTSSGSLQRVERRTDVSALLDILGHTQFQSQAPRARPITVASTQEEKEPENRVAKTLLLACGFVVPADTVFAGDVLIFKRHGVEIHLGARLFQRLESRLAQAAQLSEPPCAPRIA